MTGETALGQYLDKISDEGFNVLLMNDPHTNKYVVNIIYKGETWTEHIDPWVSISESSEWLLIDRIAEVVNKIKEKEKLKEVSK